MFDIVLACGTESYRLQSPRVARRYAQQIARKKRSPAVVTALAHEGRCVNLGYADKRGRWRPNPKFTRASLARTQ
jgi:hypothetical protein